MTNKALDTSQKYSYLYVTFYNPATVDTWKYTDWADPSDTSFTFEPKLAATIADNVGTFEQKVTLIDLPYGDAFTAMVASGEPLPPLYVTISEQILDPPGLADGVNLVLFKGQVSKVIRNHQGRSGAVRIECVSMKGLLDVPLGLPCTQQCVFTFGGIGCEKDLTPLKKNGTLAAIGGGRSVTITGLPATPGGDLTYWRFGSVAYRGLGIVIRDWDSSLSTTNFVLRDRPPASWVGQTVVVTPGCDKALLTCRNRWANEGQFGGFGIAMPDYMPNIETG